MAAVAVAALPADPAAVEAARQGQMIPNLVIVPLGAGSKISLYSQSGTDLVVDVTGYYISKWCC